MTSPYYPAHDADGEVVMFTDREGTTWSAHEMPGDRLERDRSDRCLVFSSHDRRRHVWNYPPNWRELSAHELGALSERSADADAA